MNRLNFHIALIIFGLLSTTSTALAQKSGQSMQIQHGVVVSSTYVQEKSDAGKSALVGGAIGYGLARNLSLIHISEPTRLQV